MKKLIFLFIFALIYSFSTFSQSQLEPNKVVTTVGEYFGYVNKSGEQVIPAKFKGASLFHNGIARVMNEENLYGYINEKGEQVVPFRFHNAQEFYVMGNNGKNIPTKLTLVWENQTEEYEKKTTNLSFEYYRGSSSNPKTAERTITLNGIINLKGDFIVPLSNEYKCRVERGYAIVDFMEDKTQFSVLLNPEGDIVIEPVNAEINVYQNNFILIYNNIRIVNGFTNYGTEIYDLEGKLLAGLEKGYSLISESVNPNILDVSRNLVVANKTVTKHGLTDTKGNEILQTLYERLIWEENKKLCKVFINKDNEVYFYVDEKGKCVKKEDAPCPEPPPASFDYQAFITKDRTLKENYRKTSTVPWLNQANANETSSEAAITTTKEIPKSKGIGPVFTDMKGIWVSSPPPSVNGTIVKIENVQKDAVCGDYKKFVGNEIGIQAKLVCIHADENGYVFYLEHYERPSWDTGKKYLQVMRTEKKGNVTYKFALFNGSYDSSFSKNKMLYNKYTEISGLGRKGYTSDWWFWSVYK